MGCYFIMNKLKYPIIAGAIFVMIIGTLAHFVYGWTGENYLVGLLFPVNESTWEHMKLLFFPMLAASLFLSRNLKSSYPCITGALLWGNLAGTALIPVLFYTYSGVLGRNYTALDIATFYISVIAAFYLVHRLTVSCGKLNRYPILPIILTTIVLLCFLAFTYNPPEIGIFEEPTIKNTSE